jgi:gliding motility-associated-like protein
MLRKIVLTAITLFSLVARAQVTTLYSNNFENTTQSWQIQGVETPNKWQQGNCAGNGPTASGDSALYISDGSAGTGCTVNYIYQNSPSGSQFSIAYTPVDATCASALNLSYDYKTGGVVAEDYTELVYSTDNGSSWNVLGSPLTINASWSNVSVSLPSALDFTSFLIGFRFTYNDATVAGLPTAIDNISVTGSDTQAPVITCPLSVNQPVNSLCQAIADDYSKDLVDLSDNCTDSLDIVLVQSILSGSNLSLAPGASTTITLTATDEAGNSNSCNFTLTAIDDTDPQITFCPGDTVIQVNNICNGVVGDYASLGTGTDNCSSVLVTQSPIAGTVVPDQGVTTLVTLTYADANGNSIQCTLNALTVDTIPVQVVCPPDTIIYADANCEAILLDYRGDAVATDNCISSGSLIVNQSPVAGTTVSSNQVLTITVTGGIPATPATCQFNAVFIDTIKPNVICPTPSVLTLDGSCEVTLPDYTSLLGWTDNCTSMVSAMTFTQSPIGGSTLNNNTTVIITATDPSGNSKSCSFTQTVIDNTAPILTCPSDQVLNLNSSCFATIPDYTSSLTSIENCFYSVDVSYTQSPVAGTTLNGPATITITGTDESGNEGTCSFNITVQDVTPPSITCPSNTTVAVDASCNYVMSDLSTTTVFADNCTPQGSLTFVQSPIAGTNLSTGTQNVQITVTDQAGLQASCSYQLTVADQTAPSITCPGNQNITINSLCEATLADYTGSAIVTDNCNSLGQLSISQLPVPGTTISSNTQITVYATDVVGNTSTCNFFALIIDNSAPTLTCPSNYNVSATPSCDYLVPDMSSLVAFNDNCPSGLTISQNPPSGTLITSGAISVLTIVSDGNGNSNSCVTLLTPLDNQAPVINCPNPAPINNGTNCNYTLTNFSTQALVLDNCSNYIITQTPAAGSVLNAGSHVIQLDVTDIGGNTAQCSFVLDINEIVPPVITCPNNITLCSDVVNFTDPVFSDNCFAFITRTDVTGLVSGDIFPIGTTTLSYLVEDSSSNTASCSFTVTVLDFPSTADILVDSISLCQVTSTVVEALPVTSGTGLWTLIAGQATFNNPAANLTGVNNLNYGTNTLVWTVSSASCGTLSDTVDIYVYQNPLPASTLDTVLLCNQEVLNLSANVPLYGTGSWTTNLGADISDISVPTATASNLAYGWNEFIWTVSNGSCASTSDTMHVFRAPVAQINQTDTAVCIENGAIDISATATISGQTSMWMFVSGSGLISDPFSNDITVSDFGLGVNYLVYHISTDICLPTSDTLKIIASLCDGFKPIFPTVITPNLDGKNDLFVIDYLNELYPECHVTIFNRWGSVVYDSHGYADPWNGTYKNEELPMGTYFYKIELNDESKTIYNGPISIIR